ALYALACALACVFVGELTGNALLALLAGAFFAVHPAHAESAAWISSRKDVLSGALGFLSLIVHVRATRNDGAAHALGVALACLLGALAMLSKSTLVCLPLLVFLVELAAPALRDEGRDPREVARGAALRSLPYFLVAALVAWNAIEVGRRTGIAQPPPAGGLATVIATDLPILVRYIAASFAPHDLRASYSTFGLRQPLDADVPRAGLVLSFTFLLAARAGLARRGRLLAFAAAWFLIGLLPVLNFVPFVQLLADRYLFLPVLGPCVVVAWAVLRVSSRSKALGLGVAAALLLVLSVLSCERGLDFATSERLFRKNLQLEPASPVAHHQLGRALLAQAIDARTRGASGLAANLARAAALEEETALKLFAAPGVVWAGPELEVRRSLALDLEIGERPLAAIACSRDTIALERARGASVHDDSIRLGELCLRLRPGAVEERDLPLLVAIARAFAHVRQEGLARETLAIVERADPARAARALESDPELERALRAP
ncbi:hypothetical protein HY251_03435, partial [bacterium]|nr:hypothetical protein [bacterium]